MRSQARAVLVLKSSSLIEDSCVSIVAAAVRRLPGIRRPQQPGIRLSLGHLLLELGPSGEIPRFELRNRYPGRVSRPPVTPGEASSSSAYDRAGRVCSWG